MIQALTPENWQQYELIDSGDFEKLERFGALTVRRPEPQALWSRSMSEADWKKLSDATFARDKANTEKGQWQLKQNIPQKWLIEYNTPHYKLKCKLSLTSFKHVGIFPEQSLNWDFIYKKVKAHKKEHPKVLNLFAYTGMASLAAKVGGADVTHLDAVKQVVSWAKENMEISNLENIRWLVEDAVKFVKREINRGNKYEGIILDPPAYGRGPQGEKWVLENQINELLSMVSALLADEHSFLVINLYSLGFSSIILENLMNEHFAPFASQTECGEIYLQDRFKKKLPLGIYGRF